MIFIQRLNWQQAGRAALKSRQWFWAAQAPDCKAGTKWRTYRHREIERGREIGTGQSGTHGVVCVLVWARLICQLVHLDNCPAINKISSNLRAERRKRTNEQGRARQDGAGQGRHAGIRQLGRVLGIDRQPRQPVSQCHTRLSSYPTRTHTLLIYSVTIFIWPPHPLIRPLFLPLLLLPPLALVIVLMSGINESSLCLQLSEWLTHTHTLFSVFLCRLCLSHNWWVSFQGGTGHRGAGRV